MNILLVGIQGSGKWTQAREILKNNPDFLFFEMGQKLRDFAQMNEPLSSIVKNHLESGTLVPSDVIEAMLLHYKNNHQTGSTILFDGIPRSIEQLDMFEKIFPDYIVIFLDLEKNQAIERLAWRRIDPANGMSFPKDFDGNFSPYTGNALVTRDDDNADAVKRRISAFYHNTLPLLAEWAARSKRVYRIDASKSIEEVADIIKTVLSAY